MHLKMIITRTLPYRALALALVLGVAACVRDTREADPYAARFAIAQSPYVRHANAPRVTLTRDSVTDPQFTGAQARSGAEVYRTVCARCHTVAQWTGGTFAAGWQDRRLSNFYDLVVTTMPQDAPASLSPEQYVNVTAYVLELAGFPSGAVALRADSAMLRHARLAIKTKPAT